MSPATGTTDVTTGVTVPGPPGGGVLTVRPGGGGSATGRLRVASLPGRALPATDWLQFSLDPGHEAAEPPEARAGGGDRADVRLLVSVGEESPVHARFGDLPRFLEPGDLLVVNTSATLPAAVDGVTDRGEPFAVHFSTALPSGLWLVELRDPDPAGSRPHAGVVDGRRVDLPGGAALDLVGRWAASRRLWLAVFRPPASGPATVAAWLGRHGRPIRYRHVPRDWPLDAYQTAFAVDPGSAEMPSAARALTPEVVTRVLARGVGITPITLHTGVSSLEGHEAPYPERVRVPAVTAERVNATRTPGPDGRRPGRVIAVGTTVVRALEAAWRPAGADGVVRPLDRWTDVVITPDRGVRAVDGLLTGWHEPEASHLLMLEAVAGRPALAAAYRAAVDGGYRWHEFGDAHLILPARS
jgi:S-adenosylmethionine:tRNA ribosyltransferase-isomerase